MVSLDPPYRRATPEDARSLMRLINYAGEGLPHYVWKKMAQPGESAWDVGQNRARRATGSFSYRNAIVIDGKNGVIACLIGYPLPDEAEQINYDELPAMFVPLQELENLASGTWYVNVLAVEPAQRGRGYGSRLLSIADDLSADLGTRGLSIITSDTNTGARRLYERTGFREVDRRPMVKEEWQNDGRDWVLLTKAT